MQVGGAIDVWQLGRRWTTRALEGSAGAAVRGKRVRQGGMQHQAGAVAWGQQRRS